MGTDNLRLLNDDMYIGNRHARVRDQRNDDLIDAYVAAATKLFPHALLHVHARRVSEGMIAAAADGVAALTDSASAGAALLPPVNNLRMISAAVAIAVARAADAQGLAEVPLTDPVGQIHQAMWRSEYPAFKPI